MTYSAVLRRSTTGPGHQRRGQRPDTKQGRGYLADLDRDKIVGGTVGLRPSRTEVRLEEEEIGGVRVIHNYGHGGAGVSPILGMCR